MVFTEVLPDLICWKPAEDGCGQMLLWLLECLLQNHKHVEENNRYLHRFVLIIEVKSWIADK